MTDSILGPEWHISDEGATLITKNGTIKDRRTIQENALNADLRKISKQLPKLNMSSNDTVSQVVLQIDKIRNVSAPKVNETSQAAPRMLKLDLVHDSKLTIQALEISPITSINIEKTPPGTKLLINGAKFESSYLILNGNNCKLLGGKVENLIEKWEMSKTARTQNSSKDGPPAWVNFGKKIQTNEVKPVKTPKTEEPKKENTEFDSQRQSAINTAANSGAIKKVFGGGVTNVRETPRESQTNHYNKPDNSRDNRSKPVKNFKKREEKEPEEKLEKRSDNISLFAYLEDKLPASSIKTTTKIETPPVYNNRDNNNFRKNENISKNSAYNNNYRKHENNVKNPSNYNSNFKKNDNTYKNTSNTSNYNNYSSNYSKNNENTNNTWKPNTFNPNSEGNLVNNFNKLSVNNEFASRSLRQHLNLERNKPSEQTNPSKSNDWSVGQECMAKYWEDGKYYNAVITAITEKTYVVKFKGYGNTEEVLKTDCLPLKDKNNSSNPNNNPRKPYNNQFSGTLEFRRGKSGNAYSDYK